MYINYKKKFIKLNFKIKSMIKISNKLYKLIAKIC